MTALVWLLTAVVVVLAVLVVGLLRSHATILRALHEVGVDLDPDRPDGRDAIRTVPGVPGPAGLTGARAADLAGTTTSGSVRTIPAVGRDGAMLLAFLTTGCGTCAAFWQAFTEGVELPREVRLVIVTKGAEAESPATVRSMAPPDAVTLQSSQAWDDYRVPAAPYFVLVDSVRGVVIGEGAAATWPRVADLLHRALADAGNRTAEVGRRDLLSGRSRARRVDDALRDAGIEPGDPRLHHR